MKKRRHVRRCMYCYQPIDYKRRRSYVEVKAGWFIQKTYLYHPECLRKKKENEAMRKYKERLHEWA